MKTNPNKLTYQQQQMHNNNHLGGNHLNNPINIRQSMHRRGGMFQDNMNNYDSPIKGRSSLLPGAQLEITKVGADTMSSQKGRKSPYKPAQNGMFQ